MRSKIVELKLNSLTRQDAPPKDYDELKGGDDVFSFSNTLIADKEGKTNKVALSVTWDKIFSYCGAGLSGECTSQELRGKIVLAYYHSIPSKYSDLNNMDKIILTYQCEDQIHVQLQALGLMVTGEKKRAVSDTNTYWKLTPFGERHLIQVRALRRDSK